MNIDTAVHEKFVTFTTDAKLYHKMRRGLVKGAKVRSIELRQTYERVGQKAFIMQSRYAHARPMKPSKAQLRKLKNYLGRTIIDIKKKMISSKRSIK